MQQLSNFEITLALLIGGSVLVLNILKAIKLWRDMNTPENEKFWPQIQPLLKTLTLLLLAIAVLVVAIGML